MIEFTLIFTGAIYKCTNEHFNVHNFLLNIKKEPRGFQSLITKEGKKVIIYNQNFVSLEGDEGVILALSHTFNT